MHASCAVYQGPNAQEAVEALGVAILMNGGPGTEPFSSCDLLGLKDVDGLDQLLGFPGAAAELAQDVPGFSWALARSRGIVAGRGRGWRPSASGLVSSLVGSVHVLTCADVAPCRPARPGRRRPARG